MVGGSNSVAVTYTSDMTTASSKEFLDIQANYRVKIQSKTCMWDNNNIEPNALYR